MHFSFLNEARGSMTPYLECVYAFAVGIEVVHEMHVSLRAYSMTKLQVQQRRNACRQCAGGDHFIQRGRKEEQQEEQGESKTRWLSDRRQV